jgi:DUF2924 family protein
MGRRSVDPETLKIEIARLRDLDVPELRNRWLELYGRPAPKTFRRNLLVRGLAYQMQVEVYGGLSTATKRRLRETADAVRAGREGAVGTGVRIKPGTRLIRVWQDKTHTVTALIDGFEWDGARYGSLSEIARSITGTRWNGLVFFGVKPRPAANKNARGRSAEHA